MEINYITLKIKRTSALYAFYPSLACFPRNQRKCSDSSGLRVGIGKRKNSESKIQQARTRISVADWLKVVTDLHLESKLPVFQT